MSRFFRHDEELRRVLEQSKILADFIKEDSSAWAKLQTDGSLRQVLEQSKTFADLAKESLGARAYLQAFDQTKILRDLTEEILMPSASRLEDLLGTQEQMKYLASSHLQIVEDLNRQCTAWQNLLQPELDIASRLRLEDLRIPDAMLAWKDNVAETVARLQEVNLFAQREDLSLRLLEPSRVYTDFVERTVWRLERNESIGNALRASLYLAESQLRSFTDILSAIVTVPTDNDPVFPVRPLRAPFLQQKELLSASGISDEEEEDEAAILQRSPTARAAEEARVVLSLVVQCNEAAKVSGQSEMFKPTTRLLEAFRDLPWLVPANKRAFADFIDCLYFIFYEGAGKDNLRFLIPHGGVLNEADCNFVWCVKYLRNKWLRHDADHGKELAISKSWEDLSAMFHWLGLQHAPTGGKHFRSLHSRLLKEAEAFLRRILDELTSDK